MKTYVVYRHTCPNGKVYIGLTCQKCESRFGKNGSKYKGSPFFYHAILKYGWENITHEIISSDLTAQEANWLENYMILYHNSNRREKGYNLTTGGNGSPGRPLSESGKRKLSESNKKRYTSQEERLKTALSNPNRKPVICVDTGEVYISAVSASVCNGLDKSTICKAIKLGRKAKGKTYKYIEG